MSEERDNTLARLKFGLHELEHGAGSMIPEPIGVMLGALVRWRVGVLEGAANEEALQGDVIHKIKVRPLHPTPDGPIIDAAFREVP